MLGATPFVLKGDMKTELFHIKKYLKASSPDELIRLQLQNNLAHSITFKYDIIFDGKSWYAWYLADATNMVKDSAVEQMNA